ATTPAAYFPAYTTAPMKQEEFLLKRPDPYG
ncbi:MAG: hypothetical protein ACI9GW_003143, partial [Halieaceae bacterium]